MYITIIRSQQFHTFLWGYKSKYVTLSGTGKTVTGVHIAYWFAERNKRLKSDKGLEKKDTGETECAGACKAPPQVIYCGPSNKSVDVVTGRDFLFCDILLCSLVLLETDQEY